MAKATFQEWLLNQLGRADEVGALAKAVMSIDSYARPENAYPAWRKLLTVNRRVEHLDALQQAWTEYADYKEPRPR